MKKFILMALILNQSAFAHEIKELGADLGMIYQKVVQLEVESTEALKTKRYIIDVVSTGVLKVALLPLIEIEAKLKSLKIESQEGRYHSELVIQAESKMITLQECLELQSLFQQFQIELSNSEKILEDVFYSSNPYQKELAYFQKMQAPLQEDFSSIIDMADGLRKIESMINGFSSIGFNFSRKVISTKAQFSYDKESFYTKYGTRELENLTATQRKELVLLLVKGPLKDLNSLKSLYSFISKRYGIDGLDALVKEILFKLKSN